MAKAYKGKILASVHEAMQDAHDVGDSDTKTMRQFDGACLTTVEALSAKEISALREREGVSQAVLARHLKVAVKLVGEGERGEKRPSGPSLKLLALVKAKGLEAIV
jgi:putative transcriptional regulator